MKRTLYDQYKDDPIKSLSFPMFQFIFSPYRLNEERIHRMIDEHYLVYPHNVSVYPERDNLRGELQHFAEDMMRVRQYDGFTILTDSDDLLNIFRVAVKDGILRKEQVSVMFYKYYGGGGEQLSFYDVDADGRFDRPFPGWMNTHTDWLMRLL